MTTTGDAGTLPVIRDVGESEEDGYVIGVREALDPEAWSLMFMEGYNESEAGSPEDELDS